MAESLTILSTFIVGVLICVLLFAYHIYVHGMPQTAELKKKGSSRILTTWMMEFAYWLLRPLVRGLVWCRIHPNTISWASVFFAGFGAVALAKGYFGYGAILSMLAFILDAVDGMVARMSGMVSRAGAVLDSTLDRYTEFLFFMGLMFYYRFEPFALGIVACALCGSWMVSYSSAKAEASQMKILRGTMRRPERLLLLVLGTAAAPVITPLVEPGAPFPLHYSVLVTVGFVAVFSNFTAIHRVYCLYRILAEKANPNGRTSILLPQKASFKHLRQAMLASSVPTIVDVAIFVFLVVRVEMNYVWAAAWAVTLGTILGFLLRRFVFFSFDERIKHRRLSQEFVIALTNIVWNVLLVYGLVEWLEFNHLLSRLIAVVSVGVVWNWPMNFYYLFPSESLTRYSVSHAPGESA